MRDILKLQQKLVPEFLELLEKRYNILRTIFYNQPIGRRSLANILNLGERVVRTEINFLKMQNLINISTPGMTLTSDGEEVIDKLKDFIHEIKGLSEIETCIKQYLHIKDIIIVPGNMDEDPTVTNEVGRAAAMYLLSLLKDNMIIATTGGSTIKEVIDNLPKIYEYKNVLVVPARGGIGRNVETQANTLSARLANQIGANYKLLHLPDNLSDNALNTILNEKDIKEVIDNIHNSNLLIYGIGRADTMARRRGLSKEEIDKFDKMGTVGEAFGYYFNRKGEVVYSTSTIGIKHDEIRKIKNTIAVAGGVSKAEAIMAAELNNYNSVLITDEGAAREILKILQSDDDNLEFLR